MEPQLVFSRLFDFICTKWPSNWQDRSPPTYSLNPKLPKQHTYILVFNLGTEAMLKFVKEQPQLNIVYESPRAVNNNYSTTQARNVLLVVEFKDEPVQTL